MASDDTKPTRFGPSRRIAVGAAVGLLAAGVLAPVGMAVSLEQTADRNIVHKPLLPSQAGLGQSIARPQSAGEALNILLVGNQVNGPKASSIMLAHISSDRERVDLIRLPRGVEAGGKSSLGTTYTNGGSPALVRSLENSLQVPIDNVAETDIQGVKGVVDAVDGIEVQTSGGVSSMDGDAALAYLSEGQNVRSAAASADRQDAVLRGIVVKLAKPSTLANPSTLSSFTDAATRNLTTDESFSASDIRNLALSLRNVRSDDIGSVTASAADLPQIGQALQQDDTAALAD